MTPAPGGGVASPCNSVCRMDPRTGLCEGCWRTIDEIIDWAVLDDAEKRAVWVALAQREASEAASKQARARAGGGCDTPQPGVP